jgi:hypothetical protein
LRIQEPSLLKVPGLIVALMFFCASAWAQNTTPPAPQWEFYASELGYWLTEGGSYVSPVLTADRRALHLEARYNYESRNTGSLWIGRNFTVGKKTTLELTPMIGAVFGGSDGVAPGLLASFQHGRVSAVYQAEYLIETDRSESFFYSWAELFYSPREWLRAGIVIQRTKAYQTEFDLQRGVFGGVSFRKADLTLYILDPGTPHPVTVLGLGFRF